MTRSRSINVLRAALAGLVLATTAAFSAEIGVFSTPTLRTSIEELRPRFETATGLRLRVTYDGVAALKRRIEAGEAFDVALLLPATIDQLASAGKIASGSRSDIARTAVGVAVREGAPPVALGTEEAVIATLLAAPSIATAPDSASSAYFLSMVERLGIADRIRPKLVAVSGGKVVEAVGTGQAALTVITVPNILGVSGVSLAGLLPERLQNYTVFSAGLATAPAEPEGAARFIAFLRAPETTATLQAHGFQRPPPGAPAR